MISGKSFSEKCKWVFDPRYPDRPMFQYNQAKPGDWIFVNGDYLGHLVSGLPFLVVKRFVFVIHNTDRSFGPQELRGLLPHSQHIYAINTTVVHPSLTTIPLGFVDRQLPFLGSFKQTYEPRDIEIYQNFTTVTNAQKRNECAQAFKDDPRVVRRVGLSVPEYYTDLCRSKYVLCPEGTGIDTHRVYEALFCGATPVVLRNSLSHLYERLPVCILESWSDTLYVPESKTFETDCARYI